MHAIRRLLRLTSTTALATAAGCSADRLGAPVVRAVDTSRVVPVTLTYDRRTITDSLHTSDRMRVIRTIAPAERDGVPAWRVTIRSTSEGTSWSGGAALDDVHEYGRRDFALLRAESRWKRTLWVAEVGADDTVRVAFAAAAGGREMRWAMPRDSGAVRGPVVLSLVTPALPLRDGWSGSVLTLADRGIALGAGLGRIALQVEARERIDVPAGSFDTWRLRARPLLAPRRQAPEWSVFAETTRTLWVDRRTGWIVRDVLTRGRGDNTVDVIEELAERPAP